MSEQTEPVTRFIVSLITYAREARDPQVDRVALIAESLHGRMKEIDAQSLARAMGDPGPAGSPTRTGIAIDALRRAQASLDGPKPDLASIKTGIAAARVLIGTKGTARRKGATFLIRKMLAHGGLAPAHLVGPGPEAEGDDQ